MQRKKECLVWLWAVMGRVREGSAEEKTLRKSLQKRNSRKRGHVQRHRERHSSTVWTGCSKALAVLWELRVLLTTFD